ncbi:S8 family peptidase [Neobacillus sp. D3-1R]|uniref:S8 family peptidase n=1 Tax=Neobacillus sp. D3-1R TaxID=3445778 RepID=UPI003FA19319
MLKRIGTLLLCILLVIPASSIHAQEKNLISKEWILYFNTIHKASQFQHDFNEQVLSRSESVIEATFTEKKLDEILHTHPEIVKVEENLQKALTGYIGKDDPYYPEQWALKKIAYDGSGLANQSSLNQLIGKTITMGNDSFLYEEKPFSGTHFIINLESEHIRRLSVELANPQGNWKVEVRDKQNQLITQNTSLYKKIDLLLPKNLPDTSLSISLIKTEGWSENPIIKKLTGVYSAIVAVIDSGVIEHEDFCDNILYSLGKDFREGMSQPIDTNGHGTHVTGIIAACSQNGIGISGAIGGALVDVIPLKALNKDGLTDDYTLSRAVQEAIDYDVDVINLSIAGKGTTEFFEDTVMEALQKGIAVVAAAGNGNEDTSDVYPAKFPGVITVAGIDQNNGKVKRSNFGWEVDISAPGINILSTYLSPSYKELTGTSMAAPYVTSAVAYYKSLHPDLDFIQIRRMLANSALDIGAKGYDIYTGAGLLQLSNSMEEKEQMDWLNLKDGQPIDDKQQIVIGFSETLLGSTLLVFKDEKFLLTKKVEKMIETIYINPELFTQHDTPLTAVVVNDKNQILDMSSLSVVNTKSVIKTGAFTDIPNDFWAYKEITKAYQEKLINGYSDGTFKPSENIGRRHTMMMLSRLFPEKLPVSMNIPFQDVSFTTPGILPILIGSENGMIKGTNGHFNPEKKITRSQVALILARALGIDEGSVTNRYPFKDIPKDAEYEQAVQQLAAKGIISKQEYFHPNALITRAQFAAMLTRTMEFMNK